ncbi:UNVERIFIED_CONTAM: hypothetical protein FKN15_068820 [Acipenser sinensis]
MIVQVQRAQGGVVCQVDIRQKGTASGDVTVDPLNSVLGDVLSGQQGGDHYLRTRELLCGLLRYSPYRLGHMFPLRAQVVGASVDDNVLRVSQGRLAQQLERPFCSWAPEFCYPAAGEESSLVQVLPVGVDKNGYLGAVYFRSLSARGSLCLWGSVCDVGGRGSVCGGGVGVSVCGGGECLSVGVCWGSGVCVWISVCVG